MNKLKHQAKIIDILTTIYSDRELGSLLGFKGGTACYLFYDLTRFSLDLDFNLLKEGTEELVYKKLESYVKNKYQIKQGYIKERTIFFLLSFENNERNIKIEISRKSMKDEYDLKEYLGLHIPVMKQEYILAHKLCALSDRHETVLRDLYDINFFLNKYWDINEDVIKTRTGKTLPEYLDFLIEFIPKNFQPQKVLDGLGELLDEEKKNEEKKNLVNDTILKLKVLLEALKTR